MKTVAHCTALYLHLHSVWIYAQLARHCRYRPVVLAQEAANLEVFPMTPLYVATDYPPARRLINRLVGKVTGEYPFYAGILKREGVSLIHAHFGHQGARCLRARSGSGLPMLTSFYGADATQDARLPQWRRRYRRLFAAGEGFLVEGNAMKAQLVAIGCPEEKVRVHHLGVEVERIPFQERVAQDRVRFLICAAFREKKGIPYALQALARARQLRIFPFEVTLVGDGPQRREIEQWVDRLGWAGQVGFRGTRSYAQVLEELARAHLLLQTSVTAASGDTEGGAPVILLDAQAAGVPVVATRHADIPEYVVDRVSGLLAPEKDVEALADCIVQLVEAPQRWAAMGRAGRRHVETHYHAARQAARLEALYDEYV